jgi:hypothetical protein
LHASTLLSKSLTLRGKNIGRWLSEASAERRASDVATAKQIARRGALGTARQGRPRPRPPLVAVATLRKSSRRVREHGLQQWVIDNVGPR